MGRDCSRVRSDCSRVATRTARVKTFYPRLYSPCVFTSTLDAYNALCCYTLERGDPEFIHQHVVDAYAAQNANEQTKPIGLTFALVGLYLHAERGFTGRQVQLAHMALAKRRQTWPPFALPHDRGAMTVLDVMAQPEGTARDQAIHDWSTSVWAAFQDSRTAIAELLRRNDVANE